MNMPDEVREDLDDVLAHAHQTVVQEQWIEWMEEALDLLWQPGLEYTNRERRAEAIEQGYKLLELVRPEGE